jgi:hypothetical protein
MHASTPLRIPLQVSWEWEVSDDGFTHPSEHADIPVQPDGSKADCRLFVPLLLFGYYVRVCGRIVQLVTNNCTRVCVCKHCVGDCNNLCAINVRVCAHRIDIERPESRVDSCTFDA